MFVAAFGAETASLLDRIAVWALPRMAEADLANASELVGKVALVDRGGVPAVEKARRVQNAGAVACVIVNTDDKSWRPGGHMPAGAAQADVGADITIPVIVVPLSASSAFGSGGGRLSMEYGKGDTPSMNAKALFKTAGRALALRSASAGAAAKSALSAPAVDKPAQRKLPMAFGDESPRPRGVATVTLCLPPSPGGRLQGQQVKIPAVIAEFGKGSFPLTGQAAVPAAPYLADQPLTNGPGVSGRIAVIGRGGATFVAKARNAVAAGACGVVYVDTGETPMVPGATSGDDDGADLHLTAVCVGNIGGKQILAHCEEGGLLTIEDRAVPME
jgi:hypothetical protein